MYQHTLVVSISTGISELRNILSLNDGDEIILKNKYFSLNIPVVLAKIQDTKVSLESHVCEVPEALIDGCGCVILTCGTEDEMEGCKQIWEAIRMRFDDEIARVFHMDFDLDDEDKMSSTMSWSVENEIELVSNEICKDDDRLVSERLAEVVSTISWENLNEDTQRKAFSTAATSMRRTLDKGDMRNVLDQLLHEDESASSDGA